MADDPSFAIPVQPRRTYPYSGGVEYEGETVFHLQPDRECTEANLDELVRDVLEAGPYQYGDFFNLPMTLYLLRDRQTDDVFRLSVRDGQIRLHVLPETQPDGLRALYDRLLERTETDWTVNCKYTEK